MLVQVFQEAVSVAFRRIGEYLVGKPCLPLTPILPVSSEVTKNGAIAPYGSTISDGCVNVRESTFDVSNRVCSKSASGPVPAVCGQNRHHERIFSMSLDHLQLRGKSKLLRLKAAGIVTAGDLALLSPGQINCLSGGNRPFQAWIRLHQRAIRLSASVEGLMPCDAAMLVRVHRTSVVSLARDNAAQLHRDLRRFVETEKGRRYLGRRRLAGHRKVRGWIAAARRTRSQAQLGEKTRPRPTSGRAGSGAATMREISNGSLLIS